MTQTNIEPIEGADSFNNLLTQFNEVVEDWKSRISPVKEAQKQTLEASQLTKTPGAKLQHVLLGFALALVSDLNMSLEDVQKQFTFTTDEPYIQIKVVEKYKPVVEGLTAWVESYFKLFDGIEELV